MPLSNAKKQKRFREKRKKELSALINETLELLRQLTTKKDLKSLKKGDKHGA